MSKMRVSLAFALTDFLEACQIDPMSKDKSKEEIYFAVCNAILRMEMVKGYLRWTLSDISRFSGVTRSLIYYYFGKEKETILDEAYRVIIGHFYNFDRMKKLPLKDRLKIVLADFQKMPYLFALRYLQNGTGSKFDLMIREAEKKFISELRKEFPESSEKQIFELYLKELGAVAYQMSPDDVDKYF